MGFTKVYKAGYWAFVDCADLRTLMEAFRAKMSDCLWHPTLYVKNVNELAEAVFEKMIVKCQEAISTAGFPIEFDIDALESALNGPVLCLHGGI